MELSTVSDVWDGDADNESVLGEMGDTAVLGTTATSWREPLRSERKAKLKAKQKEKAGQVPFHVGGGGCWTLPPTNTALRVQGVPTQMCPR